MRVSSQQVKSIKCSNEISRPGNDNDYHLKRIFSIVLNGFVFFVQLLKANEIKKSIWLMMSILFVLVRRSDLVQ